jgi:acetyl esterase/lipase
MGDSSGCALAVSALLALKQGGVRMPRALAFITPVFDLAGKGETFLTRAEKDPFELKDPLGIAKIYVGSNNPLSPMLSPLYGELQGLPPVLIHAADYDVFLSDSYRFKENAEKAGVNVELKVWRKMWHIFHMQSSFVPESMKALKELCSHIN